MLSNFPLVDINVLPLTVPDADTWPFSNTTSEPNDFIFEATIVPLALILPDAVILPVN